MRKAKMPALMLLAVCFWAAASAATIPLTNSQKVGESRMSVLFWDVYDAVLFAPNGAWSWDAPFVLELNYLMELSGEDIAQRSVEEMRKQGFTDEITLAAWFEQMRALFPDVAKGSSLSALYTPTAPTQFFHNGAPIGSIHDPEFGTWFLSIWLGEKTSQPDFRAALLGKK